jgi:hypothetical protein
MVPVLSHMNTVHTRELHMSPVCAVCPTNLATLDLMTRIMFGDEKEPTGTQQRTTGTFRTEGPSSSRA